MTDLDMLTLRVHRLEWAARDVLELELHALGGVELPPYSAGAHIDLLLPIGLSRSYSLVGDPDQRDRYIVGVGLDAASRGGSAYIHQSLRIGDELQVRAPQNSFPLIAAAKTVLIAGGIGVTPMTCMARALARQKSDFELYYAVRQQDRAAFLDKLRDYCANLILHTDDTAGGPLNIKPIVDGQPAGTHFYCCGPAPMLAAFEAATATLPAENIHVEYFTAKPTVPGGEDESFTLVLDKSGKTIEVAAEEGILQALERIGVAPATSCEEGICGTCETRILEGTVDHRDSVLTKKEQEAGQSMMICVSRCKGDRLVLDL